MSVTFPAGFIAAGISTGLKAGDRRDLAVVINQGPSLVGSAVFTSNRAKANPILWSEQALLGGVIKAVVLNSGGANCFTGDFGYETSRLTATTTAELLGCEASAIQVCSTGLIGAGGEDFREKIVNGLPTVVGQASSDGDESAAEAIMTTDTVPKTAVFEGEGWKIGGMAKGAGMLAPGLATMLVVLTTDADIHGPRVAEALQTACDVSFNRLDSDGCMSTNDQVTLMVSGASGITPDYGEFVAGLIEVCLELALKLLADAEGASHDIAINVSGAASVADALEVGRSVARNNLVKAAIFGNDPNWGRVLAAIGTTTASFDPYNVAVSMNNVQVCDRGQPDRPREEVDLSPRDTVIDIDLRSGDARATIWTNDLTHDYVHENSAYSS